jgi:8-oxo-dGTP diphosphatase
MKQVTLIYLRRDSQILLAMKKRGFGIGKWNGPGGKVEPGETIEQAAIRECQEEIGITPHNIKLVGRLHFFMPNDPNFEHDCSIFSCRDWEGEPTESEEMRPEWFTEQSIPYADMWPDDTVWMPLLLADKLFAGTINTSESELISHTIKPVASL